MVIFDSLKSRLSIIGDRDKGGEQRVFAALELFCLPVSFFTLFVLMPLRVAYPEWFQGVGLKVLAVLISAAVGYITNFIAIEMLFKPYQKTWRHPFAWITGGYWRQGLVPKNKNKIATQIAEQVETRLLDPERMAEDLCAVVSKGLRDKEVVDALCTEIKETIAVHEQSIVDFILPRIEKAALVEIDKLVTTDNVKNLCHSTIEPKLRSEKTRALIARHLTNTIQTRSPHLAKQLKIRFTKRIAEFFHSQGALGALFAPLAGGLADFIVTEESIKSNIEDWLAEEGTQAMFQEELLGMAEAFRDYIDNPQSHEQIEEIVNSLREKFKEFLMLYLREKLPATLSRILNSPELVVWVETSFLPRVQPRVEVLVRKFGADFIRNNLHISERVEEAIGKQDVMEFHGMINEIAAQHLGAIQVLGYLLGALVGLCQLF